MADRSTVLVYCQHSLGLGHLKRTWALAESLSTAFRVVLASGGERPRGLEPPPIDVVDLPALAEDADGRLVSTDDSTSLERLRQTRMELLRDTYRAVRPQIVLIELFPFGRRKFRREIGSLLEATRRGPRPIVATSVRDLLVDRGVEQQAHDDRVRELLDTHFDLVLVHADPRFATLSDTFKPSVAPRVPIHHTGFVVPKDTIAPVESERRGILVSGGGGRFAERLYLSAVDACAQFGSGAPPMTIVTGPLCTDDVFDRVCRAASQSAASSVRVQRVVPELCRLMQASALSVSQCGYNTALDILRSRVPALVVPFSENGDSEQTDRALRLERINAVRTFRGTSLDGRSLAAAMRDALRFVPDAPSLDLGGAEATTRILATLLERRAVSEAAQLA
jgi:predicted glycosyltransferase